jgi:hypothetical protein
VPENSHIAAIVVLFQFLHFDGERKSSKPPRKLFFFGERYDKSEETTEEPLLIRDAPSLFFGYVLRFFFVYIFVFISFHSGTRLHPLRIIESITGNTFGVSS